MDTHPIPNSLARRDAAVLLHPYGNAAVIERDGPLVMTHGKGIYVYDENGKEYLEGLAGLWCTSLGFGEERLAEAAMRQMKALPFYHTFAHKGNVPNIELAERLIAMAPVPMSRVFFTNSGSEAIDTAIKIIWYYNNAIGRPEKKKIIGRVRGYHGVTIAAASLTGVPTNHTAFDLPIDRFHHTDMPHHYRFGKDGESEEDFATRCADSLEKLILDEGPETIAAFFAEPVMAAGGVIVPPATYFDKIQAVLAKYDVLMVADEVICGFGRTGNMWGSETYGIKPDMMTMAKALSSAYLPIAAVMMSDEIFRGITPQTDEIGFFGHGFTYGGHPVSAAVALETLKIYEEMDLVSHVKATSPHMQDGIRKFADHPLVGEVSGVGMIAAVELVRDKATKAPFDPKDKVGAALGQAAEQNGLICRVIGDRIAFSPPLIITPDEIAEMFRRFSTALDEAEKYAASLG